MAALSKSPILVDQPIIEGLKRLQDEEAKRSTVGAAPSIQALARQILRQGINKHSAANRTHYWATGKPAAVGYRMAMI